MDTHLQVLHILPFFFLCPLLLLIKLIKMVKITQFASLLPLAAAWPTVMEMNDIVKRVGKSGRLNTGGGHPNPTFDAESQYVNVKPGSEHEFRPPGHDDLRGECPGLNAAANHGFLPRNGKATIVESMFSLVSIL